MDTKIKKLKKDTKKLVKQEESLLKEDKKRDADAAVALGKLMMMRKKK